MTTTSITVATIRERLEGLVDSVGKSRDGTFIVRREFFYRHGKTADDLRDAVRTALGERVVILDHGEHYAAFRGGASVAQSSHWWVKFRAADEQDAAAPGNEAAR